jgi:hypothetical protein
MATTTAELIPMREFVRVVTLTCGLYHARVGVVRERNDMRSTPRSSSAGTPRECGSPRMNDASPDDLPQVNPLLKGDAASRRARRAGPGDSRRRS